MKYRITIDGKLLHGLCDVMSDDNSSLCISRSGVQLHRFYSPSQWTMEIHGIDLICYDDNDRIHFIRLEFVK